MSHQWYEAVTGLVLNQGDILFDCVVPVPQYKLGEDGTRQLKADGEIMDLIVVTQSCDLVNPKKTRRVLLCPVDQIQTALQHNPSLDLKDLHWS